MNTLFLKSILLILTSLVAIPFANQGFFADTWQPRPAETFDTWTDATPSSGTADVVINVDFSDTISKVLPTLWGNNIAGYNSASMYSNSDVQAHTTRAGFQYMRLPGGNWSNQWMWDGAAIGPFKDNYEAMIKSPPALNWTRSSEEMYAFALSVNAIPQPCVNYSLARFYNSPDRVQKAAGYAAAWVRDWNVTKKRAVPYWEVGNENMGNWQAGYTVTGLDTIHGDEYGRDFTVFADSMKAADPTIKIGAQVVSADDGGKTSGYQWWNRDVLPEIQNKADFLIIHQYFTWAPDKNTITVQDVINGIHQIKSEREGVQASVAKYTNLPGDHFPIAMTEYNMSAGTKNTAFVSTVFITMAIGEFVREKYGLVNIWDLVNGYSNGNDHGTLSKGSPYVPDWTPQGNFYAYYYTQRFFGDVMVNATSSDLKGLYVYATRFSTGEAGLVIVNPTDVPHTLDLNLQNFSKGDRAWWYTIQGDNGLDRTFEINGQGPSLPEYGPTNYWSIAPRSTQLNANNMKFTASAWTTNYLMIQSSSESVVNNIAPVKAPTGEIPLQQNRWNLKGQLIKNQLP
jgi:hypothetical protein